MPAYLIEVDDTGCGINSPTIVGPFPDGASAEAFAKEMHMGNLAQSQGGYSAVHVISDGTCTKTPEQYRAEHDHACGCAEHEENDR